MEWPGLTGPLRLCASNAVIKWPLLVSQWVHLMGGMSEQSLDTAIVLARITARPRRFRRNEEQVVDWTLTRDLSGGVNDSQGPKLNNPLEWMRSLDAASFDRVFLLMKKLVVGGGEVCGMERPRPLYPFI